VPWGLRHFQRSGQLHFLTFSCYRRRWPNFATPHSRGCFESSLERVRQSYGLCVYGYVVMPEHVHLLVNEPERGCLAQILQSLKQSVARTHLPCEQQIRSGKRVTTTSTCGARANLWRSCATSIVTQLCADWWSSPRTGRGAASVTISPVPMGWSRSNRNGQHGAEKNWGSCRQLAFTKTPPKRSLSGAPLRVV